MKLQLILGKMDKTANVIEHESRPVARKPRDAAAVLLRLKFADNIHYKFKSSHLRKPGFRAPNTSAENRI